MLASIFPWILFVIACLFAGYEVYYYGAPIWEAFLLYVVVFNGGIQGLWAALGHLAFPERTAKSIGWESCGFQTEIGSANLAIGIAGILCFFFPYWSLPVGLILSVFFLGCAYTHIKDRMVNKNNAPCNSGPMLYNTLVVAFSILISIGMIVLRVDSA